MLHGIDSSGFNVLELGSFDAFDLLFGCETFEVKEVYSVLDDGQELGTRSGGQWVFEAVERLEVVEFLVDTGGFEDKGWCCSGAVPVNFFGF